MSRLVRLTSAVKMDWPYPLCGDAGAIISVHDSAAVFLVKQKLGEYHGPADPGATRAELERQEEEIKAQPKAEVAEKADEEAEPPKRPYGNAPKSAWERYAVAVDPDLSEERASTMTKADLMSRYGSRL